MTRKDSGQTPFHTDIWSSYDENAPRSKDEYFGNKWTIGNIRKETENGKRTRTEVLELKEYVLSSTVRQWNISLNKGSSNIGMAEKCEWIWSHISRNYLVITEGKKKRVKRNEQSFRNLWNNINSPLQQKIFAELMAKNFINLVKGKNLEIQKPQTGQTQRNPCHDT